MGLQNLQYQKKFLNREEMLRHLQEFRLEIKPTVGVWSLTPSGGRFHEPYGAEVSIPERIKMIGEMAEIGVRGLEAHYGPEINEDNLHLYKQLEKDTGIRISGIGPHTFTTGNMNSGHCPIRRPLPRPCHGETHPGSAPGQGGGCRCLRTLAGDRRIHIPVWPFVLPDVGEFRGCPCRCHGRGAGGHGAH